MISILLYNRNGNVGIIVRKPGELYSLLSGLTIIEFEKLKKTLSKIASKWNCQSEDNIKNCYFEINSNDFGHIMKIIKQSINE